MGTQTLTSLLPPPQPFRRWASLESCEEGLAKAAPGPEGWFSDNRVFSSLGLHKYLLPK